MKASILNRELSFSGFISIIWAWSSFMLLLPFYILKVHSHTHSLDLYLHELESSLHSLVDSFTSDLTSRSVLSLLKGLQKIISWHQGTSVWSCLEFPSGKVILSSLYKTGSIFSGKDGESSTGRDMFGMHTLLSEMIKRFEWEHPSSTHRLGYWNSWSSAGAVWEV